LQFENNIHQKLLIMKRFFILFAAMALLLSSYAQLIPDASIAPDFTVYEINKTNGQMITNSPINLYSMLNDYKTVYVDVSASTCGPCYYFHNTHTLETLWENYGPNSVANDSRVLFIEGARTGSTWASLTGNVQGTWDVTNGVNYPVCPLYISPNNQDFLDDYFGNSIYFPTVFMACPSRRMFEMPTSTSENLAELYHTYKEIYCVNTVNDAYLGFENSAKSVYYCEYNFTPTVTLYNVGSANLTSAVLKVTHGSDVQMTEWTGNLEQYQSTQVNLTPVAGTENGTHSYTVEIVSVNGADDEGSEGNTHTEYFKAQVTPSGSTASQNFSNPQNIDPWNTSGSGFIIYNGALVYNAYSIQSGSAELMAPLLDLSDATVSTIMFSYAHKRYNATTTERLRVMVSSDCGQSWTTLWNKAGAELATVTGYTGNSNYIPSSTAEYKTAVVDLSSFLGQERVWVKFVFTSGYGNNIWLDNVNISHSPVSIQEVEDSNLYIYPNPVKDMMTISYDKAISQIDVYDVNGKLVKTFTTVNGTINISDLSDGVYMLNIQTEEGLMVRKIVKE
jgi:hypothetical protein